MAWYRSGTVSVAAGTAGSTTTVTGVGTSWNSSAAVGEMFYHSGDQRYYEITVISSDTALTILSSTSSVAISSLAAGSSYHIAPTQSYIRNLATQAAQLVTDYSTVKNESGAGKFTDGIGTAGSYSPGIRFTADDNTGIRRTGSDSLALVAGGYDQVVANTTGLVVQDAKLSITGSADVTKIAKFEADGLTTATTRTFTLPDANTTLVGIDNVQTLTNKALSTGSTVNNTAIGATAPSTGAFTALSATGKLTASSATEMNGDVVISKQAMASLTYDGVSFSVTSQETNPTGVTFRPDGRVMFVVGSVSDKVHAYTLGTPWVLSTAVFSASSITLAEPAAHGIYFKPDGLAFYCIGQTNDKVITYTLTKAWDISTAALAVSELSVLTQDTAMTGVFFRPDGSRMYTVGSTADTVWQYDLATAWNIATAGAPTSFSVVGQETVPQEAHLSADGSRMYVLGQTGDDVTIYTLSTAWDITSATFLTQVSIAGQDNLPSGMYVRPDGAKLYMVGLTVDTVYQYTIPTSVFNVSGAVKLNGAATVQQDLTVYGSISTLSSEVALDSSVGGNLTVGGTATLTGAVSASDVTASANPLVNKTDVGADPNELSLNAMLGNMAFQNKEGVVISPAASASPNGVGDLVFQLTSNTSLTFKVKGSDGVVRSASITLA